MAKVIKKKLFAITYVVHCFLIEYSMYVYIVKMRTLDTMRITFFRIVFKS